MCRFTPQLFNYFLVLKNAFMKLKKIKSCWCGVFNSAFKKHDASTLTFETGENVYFFFFISSFGVCIYHRQYLFAIVWNQTSNKKCLLDLNKNYQPIWVWSWFVYKMTVNACRSRVFIEIIQTWKRYPTFLNKISILV